MNKTRSLFHTLVFSILLTQVQLLNAAESFPARASYSSVPYITTDDLFKKRRDVSIVDTRSKFEFSILHIQNATNIPIAELNFTKRVKSLYQTLKKPIVFYCNGHTCTKSYEAVIKAKKFAKINNTMAYDAGVSDWAVAHPNHTVLLDKILVDTNKLISEADFNKHLVSPKEFYKLTNKNCLILDIRDRSQRQDRLFPGIEKFVSLDSKGQLDKYINQAKQQKKPLCVYDAVGRQIRWFQYLLDEKKVKNYYFLNGGAKAYQAIPTSEL